MLGRGAIQRPPSPTALRASRRMWLFASGALFIFFLLAIGYSFTRQPWWDEGVFADVALNFRNHGHLGSSTLYSYGYLKFPQADRYTYWQFPLYLVSVGAWFRVMPTTIESMRLFSVLWGSLYIVAWFIFVRSLTRQEPLALLVTCVVGLDYACLSAASDGRMDMMCAALGQAGLASFAALRESDWSRGVVLAACFGAASLFCHPMGAVTNCMILATILLNSQQIRWKTMLAASVPYVVGTLLCLVYILRAPSVFLEQSRAASGYRVTGVLGLLHNLLNDFWVRYVGYYFTGLAGINKLKCAALIFAVAGMLGVAFDRELRSRPLGKTLLVLACVGYAGVALLDNQRIPVYFIYSMPIMAACGASWAYYQWQKGRIRRVPAILLASSVLVGVGGFSYKIHLNEYQNLYQPAIAAINAALRPGDVVMGGSELGFALGFGRPLIDDRYLGYFSGITPEVYVVNNYYQSSGSPPYIEASHFTQSMLQRFHLTFANKAYRVYVLNRAHSSEGAQHRMGSDNKQTESGFASK